MIINKYEKLIHIIYNNIKLNKIFIEHQII